MLRVCALVLVRPPYRQTSDEGSRVGGNLRISEMEKQVELGIPARAAGSSLNFLGDSSVDRLDRPPCLCVSKLNKMSETLRH
jgi:hypothetical protein